MVSALFELCGSDLSIEARDAAGWTPLMNAAVNGHLGIVRRLAVQGARLDAADKEGRTALHQ